MKSIAHNFNALVIGSNGGIGNALKAALEQNPSCANVVGLSRSVTADFDLRDEKTIESAAWRLSKQLGCFHLIVCATGILDVSGNGPEKSLAALDAGSMATAFAVNSIGPALLFKHLSPLLPVSGKCVFAVLSARIGSIGDNNLGGWYSYRASKAALNQIVKTASVEIARKRPEAVCLALHPGTIETKLTRKLARGRFTHDASDAAQNLLNVIDSTTPERSGAFLAYDGSVICW